MSPTSASSSRTAPRSRAPTTSRAQSRLTVYAGAIPELVNQSFGAQVTFTFAGAAERAMYFGTPTFSGGHESAGVTRPSTSWFLAEGATGSFFTTFVLLSNPNATPAAVTLTYLREGGGTVTSVKTIPAGTRLTINIAIEDPSLAATSVATRVTSDVADRRRAGDVLADDAGVVERGEQRLRRDRDGARGGGWPRGASAVRTPSRRSSSWRTRT